MDVVENVLVHERIEEKEKKISEELNREKRPRESGEMVAGSFSADSGGLTSAG